MAQLKDFESRDFIEQVSLMGSLVQDKDYESIPEIICLVEKISRHDAIGLVIRDTLKSLFAGSESHTVRFLESENREIQRLCIDVAGQQKFRSGGDVLLGLAGKANDKKDYGLLFSLISSISEIKPAGFLDLLKKCIDHEDPLISSQSIEILGTLGDLSSLSRLCEIITEAESNAFGGECDLPAASAVSTLAKLKSREAIYFLTSKVHHRNPAARRLIHQELADLGPAAIEPLASVFERGDLDEKILAANILGCIASKDAGEVLVKALDKGLAPHPNVRFAIYEALGSTPGMTSLVCLADALEETDAMVLMAVVSSLDAQLNPWLLEKISGIIMTGSGHGTKLAKAIVASRALHIFEGLYLGNETIASLLVKEISLSGDAELIGLFRDKLAGMSVSRAQNDVQTLESTSVSAGDLHILAVDDSKAMLNFYKSVAASMGLKIWTAENGKEALLVLSGKEKLCLVITDMNMPVMDGIEFTRQVRCMPDYENIPVLMITTESESSQKDLAWQAGASGFLHKPFSEEKLQETIRQYLS